MIEFVQTMILDTVIAKGRCTHSETQFVLSDSISTISIKTTKLLPFRFEGINKYYLDILSTSIAAFLILFDREDRNE